MEKELERLYMKSYFTLKETLKEGEKGVITRMSTPYLPYHLWERIFALAHKSALSDVLAEIKTENEVMQLFDCVSSLERMQIMGYTRRPVSTRFSLDDIEHICEASEPQDPLVVEGIRYVFMHDPYLKDLRYVRMKANIPGELQPIWRKLRDRYSYV